MYNMYTYYIILVSNDELLIKLNLIYILSVIEPYYSPVNKNII